MEATKEEHLAPQGDCIIAVGADKGARDLSSALKELIKEEGSRISLTLTAGPFQEVIQGRGHPKLSFQNPRCMVFRKSTYICERTVMIQADKAAAGLDRNLISLLRHDKTRLLLTLEVTV